MADQGTTSGLFRVNRVTIRGRIMGPLPGKSNQRRIIPGKGGRPPMIIKNAEALAYERLFETAVVYSASGPLWAEVPLPAERYYLYVNVWPDSMRRDLDCELLPDLLQKTGIIKNDRQIWSKEYHRVAVDKIRPRIEFEIGGIAKEHWTPGEK